MGFSSLETPFPGIYSVFGAVFVLRGVFRTGFLGVSWNHEKVIMEKSNRYHIWWHWGKDDSLEVFLGRLFWCQGMERFLAFLLFFSAEHLLHKICWAVYTKTISSHNKTKLHNRYLVANNLCPPLHMNLLPTTRINRATLPPCDCQDTFSGHRGSL